MQRCLIIAATTVMFIFFKQVGNAGVNQSAGGEGNIFSIIPFESLILPAAAAFVAYYFWSAYNRPYLVLEGHDELDLILPQRHKNNKKKHRLQIRNLGRVPATNCRAFFQIKGEKTGGHIWDELIFINMPLAWYNKRGHLFTNQKQDYSETRSLAPGEMEYVDLFEQPDGQLKPYDWVDPSKRPILYVRENNRGEFDLEEIEETVIFRDSSNDPGTDDVSYEQKMFLSYSDLREYNWVDAKVILKTNQGGQIVHHCDFEWSDNDDLNITVKNKTGFKKLRDRVRRIDYRLWNY